LCFFATVALQAVRGQERSNFFSELLKAAGEAFGVVRWKGNCGFGGGQSKDSD
jgi:hypothetical protein